MTDGSAIDQLLDRVRAGLERVEPADLPAEMAAGAVLVDIRPVEQRARDGDLPGAVVVDRNVLEWRLDPTSPHRLPIATDADVRYVVVCNEGYSSSLAATILRELGLRRATDLAGGFQAWAALRTGPGRRQGDPEATSASKATRLDRRLEDAYREGSLDGSVNH